MRTESAERLDRDDFIISGAPAKGIISVVICSDCLNLQISSASFE